MKRLLSVLALAALAGGAIVTLRLTTQAMPPPPQQVIKIVCDGNIANCCQGSGPRNFYYRVQIPSGGAVQVDRVDIGTDDGNISHYSSFVLPANWTATIVSASPPDNPACTNHGGNTIAAGNCPYNVRFDKGTGVAQTSNFQLGFDYIGSTGHDVNWHASLLNSSNSANWTKPVGLGLGPVHGPKGE